MAISEPVQIAAAALVGVLLSELRQWRVGRKQNKADLSELEQRIAGTLLSTLDTRLKAAESKITVLEAQARELEAEVRDLRYDRDRLERDLAAITHERDALLQEREGLLNRLSVLVMPEVAHHESEPPGGHDGPVRSV